MQRKVAPPAALGADPAWILGLWRSGTTALHQALANDPQFCTPSTWQCMAPSSFAISGRPRKSASIARPMDAMLVDTDSPQEDEFAWLLLGGDSAYRGFLDPTRFDDLEALLNPAYWDCETPWAAEGYWRDFLGQIVAAAGSRKRLLMKSPNHTFRILGLLRRFPSSPCVWITREPSSIVQSNLKMWRSMIGLYGLTAEQPAKLEAFLSTALIEAASILTTLCARLDRRQLVVVRQEDLRLSPCTLVAETMARWGLSAASGPDRALLPAPAAGSEADPTSLPAAWQPAVERLRVAQLRAQASHGIA